MRRGKTRTLGASMGSDAQKISPEDALDRAFWMVKVPSISALVTPMFAFVFLAKLKYIPSIGYEGMKWGLPAFLLGFIAGWLVWSVQVPRWRLWAYPRVRDIALLKELAAQSNLLWRDGTLFAKTEIMSNKVRDELRRLEAASEQHGA